MSKSPRSNSVAHIVFFEGRDLFGSFTLDNGSETIYVGFPWDLKTHYKNNEVQYKVNIYSIKYIPESNNNNEKNTDESNNNNEKNTDESNNNNEKNTDESNNNNEKNTDEYNFDKAIKYDFDMTFYAYKSFFGYDNQYPVRGVNSFLFLIEKSPNKYIYVGPEIIEFTLNDTIEMYYSPIGNSGVCYPYGESKNYFYLFSFELEGYIVRLSKSLYTKNELGKFRLSSYPINYKLYNNEYLDPNKLHIDAYIKENKFLGDKISFKILRSRI